MSDSDKTQKNNGDPAGALKRDWEQTKSDMPGMEGKDLDQDVDDTVKQAAGTEATPSEETQNQD
jgi:hypothetical protein